MSATVKTAPTAVVEQQSPRPPRRLMPRKEVLARAGNISYPTVWRLMKEGRFPRPHMLGKRALWDSWELEDHLLGLPIQTPSKTA